MAASRQENWGFPGSDNLDSIVFCHHWTFRIDCSLGCRSPFAKERHVAGLAREDGYERVRDETSDESVLMSKKQK